MKLYSANPVLKVILPCLLLTVIIACNNEKTADTEKAAKDAPVPGPEQLVFEKLVGTWQNENDRSFEQWTKNPNGTYRSRVFSLSGTDTSWSEQADIYPENGNWIFENTVQGQNEGKAVKFVGATIGENSVQFSNPAHDFPTDINYTIADVNTLNAFIVGPNSKGGKDTIPFNYKRVN